MMNPPSCLIGNLPNNLDIDLNDMMQQNMMNGNFGQPGDGTQAQMQATSGQIDMAQLNGAYQG